MALEQKIIKLVRLNAAEGVRNMGFSSPCISIGTRSLIRIKSISKSVSRSLMVDFIFILLSLYLIFLFFVLFNVLFLEQLGLGVISHAVTSVTSWWHSHRTDHGTWENEVEGSGTK